MLRISGGPQISKTIGGPHGCVGPQGLFGGSPGVKNKFHKANGCRGPSVAKIKCSASTVDPRGKINPINFRRVSRGQNMIPNMFKISGVPLDSGSA